MAKGYLLELDGKPAGRLLGMSGEIESIRGRKSITPLLSDIVFTCGAAMSREFWEWIGQFARRNHVRKTGAIVVFDYNQVQLVRWEFTDALLKSILLPVLDASSKMPAQLTIAFRPAQQPQVGIGGGKVHLGAFANPNLRPWTSGGYRLSIEGLEKDCSKVTKISSVSIGQEMKMHQVGPHHTIEPTKLKPGNLSLTLPWVNSVGFYGWADSLTTAAGREKDGKLEYTDPSSSRSYLTLSFNGLSPISTTVQPKTGGSTNRPVVFEMSCNSIDFAAGADAII